MRKYYQLYKDKYKHFNLLLLFIPSTLIFYFLQYYTEPKYIMHSKLDDYIPFIRYFVVPYVMWYFYLAWAFIFLGFHSKDEFVLFVKFIIMGALVSYVIYFIFPNGQDLRAPIEGSDIFATIINSIRNSDPPTNVCPSLHVYNSIGINIAVVMSSAFKNKKGVKIFAAIMTVAISCSTVFIKQHSILDVFAAIIMASALYMLIYYPYLKTSSTQKVFMGSEI